MSEKKPKDIEKEPDNDDEPDPSPADGAGALLVPEEKPEDAIAA